MAENPSVNVVLKCVLDHDKQKSFIAGAIQNESIGSICIAQSPQRGEQSTIISKAATCSVHVASSSSLALLLVTLNAFSLLTPPDTQGNSRPISTPSTTYPPERRFRTNFSQQD